MKKLLFFALFVCSLSNNSHASPIWISDHQPLALARLSLAPTAATIEKQGSLRLDASLILANSLNYKRNKLLVDAETRTANFNFAYSFTDTLEGHLYIPVVYRGAGVMDSGIDTWHQWFDLPRGDRDNVDDNQFSISGETSSGKDFNLRSKGTHQGDITLGLKKILRSWDENKSAVSLLFQTQLPTAHSTFGHDDVDLLFGLIATKDYGEFALHCGTSYTFLVEEKIQELEFNQHQVAGFVNGEYLLSDKWSVQLGLVARNKLAKNIDYPNHSLYLDIGTRTKLSENLALTLLLRENPSHRDSTTDVAFLFGIEYK